MALMAIVALEVLVPPQFKIVAHGGAAGVAACATAALWLRASRDQKALDQFLPIKTLKQNNVYGSLPGDVAADLLNTDCSSFYVIPSLRVMRSSKEHGAFSHALVVGNRVALLRAVHAPEGQYYWSGPSLLRRVPNAYPEKVMAGPYADFLREARANSPKVEIESWLFVYTGSPGSVVMGARDGSMPQVVSPAQGVQEVGEFLVGARQEVHQDQVIKTVSILS